MNTNIVTNVGIGVASAGVGFAAGYFLAKKKTQKLADEEILSVKEAYHKRLEEKPPISEVAKELRDRAEEELHLKTEVVKAESVALEAGYIPGADAPEGEFRTMPLTGGDEGNEHNLQPGERTYLPETDPEEEALQENFESNGVRNMFDTEDEQKLFERNAEAPYLVTEEAWGSPEGDNFEKMALIYYSGDNTLTDESDRPIEAIEELVGSKNLTMFGRGQSGDDLILYVRNEQTKTDYEILHRKTSYQMYILTEHPDQEE